MTKETKNAIKVDTNTRYRLSIFRSNKAIYAQIVDDKSGVTIGSASSLKIKEKKSASEKAVLVGETLAKLAGELKIKKITYDRGPYRYHGQVKALAEGMRKAGLDF